MRSRGAAEGRHSEPTPPALTGSRWQHESKRGHSPVRAVERAGADEDGLAGGLAVGTEGDQCEDLPRSRRSSHNGGGHSLQN